MQADSLALDTPGQKLREVRGFGRAWLGGTVYEPTKDRDWMRGDTVIAKFAARDSAGTQRATLTQIRANRAVDHSQGFPIEFQVASRTEAQWVALRDALANEKQAIKYPDTLDQDAQTLLSTTRAEGAVAAARTALDANLPAVQTAWNTAAGTGQ